MHITDVAQLPRGDYLLINLPKRRVFLSQRTSIVNAPHIHLHAWHIALYNLKFVDCQLLANKELFIRLHVAHCYQKCIKIHKCGKYNPPYAARRKSTARRTNPCCTGAHDDAPRIHPELNEANHRGRIKIKYR